MMYILPEIGSAESGTSILDDIKGIITDDKSSSSTKQANKDDSRS